MLKGNRIPLYNRDTMNRWIRAKRFSESEVAQFRLKVIEFSKKYGIKAAVEAFDVSKATIFRWKKLLKDSEGQLDSLIPKSRKPKIVRTMKITSEIVTFVREVREEHPKIGKEKTKKLNFYNPQSGWVKKKANYKSSIKTH